MMLKKIRITVAILFFILITLLFLDFTGAVHHWFGWVAKIQFLPALLALNIGVVLMLVVLTAILGRIYCSVVCPLGVFQDFVSWIAGRRKKNRFSYSPAYSWARYGVLALFVLSLVGGFNVFIGLLDPYGAYGRIAANLFVPVYQLGNNILAYIAERMNSYAFYSVDIWIRGGITLGVAILTFIIVAVLAWKNGRTYCSVVCPVGTVLGFIARYSFFRPTIDTEKCNKCGLCARNCKASCIESSLQRIDYSRCVTCMNCIEKCKRSAIKYKPQYKLFDSTPKTEQNIKATGSTNTARRSFLSVVSLFAFSAALTAQQKKVEGGLAVIENKKVPRRTTPLVPFGALGIQDFTQHCTACQLCVSACPNQVLRPSHKWKALMQPEMSYERGYCRPECTRCSHVCPTGAIRPISEAEKSAIQIGHAVWIKKNCLVVTDKISCGNCARHCPTGAIKMVLSNINDPNSLKMPTVDTERCIGCGACENLCPARPFSAIYVEGHEKHRIV